MRALLIERPGEARVIDVEPPAEELGKAGLRVRRIGLCGTDLSTFLGKIRMFEERRFPTAEAISATVPLEEAPAMLRAWSENPAGYSKIMISLD